MIFFLSRRSEEFKEHGLDKDTAESLMKILSMMSNGTSLLPPKPDLSNVTVTPDGINETQ